MKICIARQSGIQYKPAYQEERDDEWNDEEIESLIECYVSKQRVFFDLSQAVETIREEEKEKGLQEMWCEEQWDENEEQVISVFLNFTGNHNGCHFDISYHFDVAEIEGTK